MENFNKQTKTTNKQLMLEEDECMGVDTGDDRNSSPRVMIPVVTLERMDSSTPARSTTSGQDNQSVASTKSYD
ncbi:hypothetical protein ACS0PU_000682 [Formica fusca]